jgi:hypothetical protein
MGSNPSVDNQSIPSMPQQCLTKLTFQLSFEEGTCGAHKQPAPKSPSSKLSLTSLKSLDLVRPTVVGILFSLPSLVILTVLLLTTINQVDFQIVNKLQRVTLIWESFQCF